MDTKKVDHTRTVLLVACALAIWFGAGTDAANRSYELHPEIAMPPAPQTDTVIVLDAYERLMDNYMSLVQSNLNAMSGDVSQGAKQLLSIEKKLDDIATRMVRIERALSLPPGAAPANAPTPSSPIYGY